MTTQEKQDSLTIKTDELVSSFRDLQNIDTDSSQLKCLGDSFQNSYGPSCDLLVEKIKSTKSEIEIIKSSQIAVIPESTSVQFDIVKNELESGVTELANTLAFIRAEAREIEIEIEEEENLKDQMVDVVIESLTRRLNEQNFETNDAEGAREKLKSDIAEKIVRANTYFKELLKESSQFYGKYFKLPTEQEFNDVQKKLRSADKTMTVRNMLSLKDIISELMNKCFDEPNQPYIILDKRYWPPYVELLLRCQIVLRHPDDPRRIKLIPFHL